MDPDLFNDGLDGDLLDESGREDLLAEEPIHPESEHPSQMHHPQQYAPSTSSPPLGPPRSIANPDPYNNYGDLDLFSGELTGGDLLDIDQDDNLDLPAEGLIPPLGEDDNHEEDGGNDPGNQGVQDQGGKVSDQDSNAIYPPVRPFSSGYLRRNRSTSPKGMILVVHNRPISEVFGRPEGI
ncbi:unnamed protein product [Calypogeia fissa]